MTATQEALASTSSETPARPDFADVYRDHITPVWQYVRSRVPNHHEAQDVTSDVFFRAFRSWTRYDVERGEVAPWLFRIAQRAVVDWLRQARRAERPDPEGVTRMSDPVEGPEAQIVRRGDLDRLGRALRELTERERDAIALRFASDMKFAEIGDVLELSAPAAKMLVWRAINKLRALFFGEEAAPERVPAAVGEVFEGAGGGAPDPLLARLFTALSVAHTHEVPPDLPERIASCVGCSKQLEKERHRQGGGNGGPSGPTGPIESGSNGGSLRPETSRRSEPEPKRRSPIQAVARYLGLVPFTGFSWAMIAPACVACSLAGNIVPLFGAFGLTAIAPWYVLHDIGLALAPLAMIPLVLNYLRHRRRLPLLIGSLGIAAIVLHSLGHTGAWPIPQLPAFRLGADGWAYAIRLGAAALFTGTMLNALAMAGWLSRQKRELACALAEGGPGLRMAPPMEKR